ncbi:MAG: hypothetical protein HYX42_12990 [Polaromonas sp.]|uniref:hypothetical protein n=1 Tax=Polaromonas sp. TaxID=1869339 RepID=UPI0025FD42E8|nr:hypothetical protein [Polaromonas sp.]MBI2727152.1 hypothetical protein [Polaromonas sp.]
MTAYDSEILEQFADRLYAKASTVVLKCIFVWLFLGLIAGGALVGWIKPSDAVGVLFVVGFSSFMFAMIGYFTGNGKAFELRLEAQRTLCYVAIERNTRHPNPHPLM